MDPPDPFQSSIKLMLEKDHGEILSWKRRALRVQLHAMAYIQSNMALPLLMQWLDFN